MAVLQEILLANNHFNSRRMMLHDPDFLNSPPLQSPPSPIPSNNNTTFDANVVMVLSVLLCALICSLGLNSIIRCAIRCSTLVGPTNSSNDVGTAVRSANKGIKKKALKTFPTISYAAELTVLDTECAICLSDFIVGERVRVLPKCHHGFHVRCIDRWLNDHSSCPTCRHCLIETCNKIVGCASAQASGTTTTHLPPPLQEVVIRIEPLQREGLIRNHQT